MKQRKAREARKETGMKSMMAIVAIVLLCAGCDKPEMVDVKCVSVHHYGDTLKQAGVLSERFTYMTGERLDTHERRNFLQVLGQTNDVFRMNWNATHYE